VPDRARLLRLRRIERMREIEKMELVRRSAQAEGTLAQLMTLAERTARLATEYATRDDADDGAALRRQHGFSAGLHSIHRTATADARSSRSQADGLMQNIAIAEQRRRSVEQRTEQTADELARTAQARATGELARNVNRKGRR
jgi:hypothetical protein